MSWFGCGRCGVLVSFRGVVRIVKAFAVAVSSVWCDSKSVLGCSRTFHAFLLFTMSFLHFLGVRALVLDEFAL
jgi:hypothetical protein